MKLFFTFFIVGFVLFPFNDSSVIDGKVLYKQNCSACHGRKGKSILVKAGDLQNPKLTLEQRVETITNGSKNNPTMIAFKEQFTKEEIRAIAVYTMTFIKD